MCASAKERSQIFGTQAPKERRRISIGLGRNLEADR